MVKFEGKYFHNFCLLKDGEFEPKPGGKISFDHAKLSGVVNVHIFNVKPVLEQDAEQFEFLHNFEPSGGYLSKPHVEVL